MVRNPHLRIGLSREGGAISKLHIFVPRKRGGLFRKTIHRADDPKTFGLVYSFAATNETTDSALETSEREALLEMGLLVSANEVSKVRPLFECRLDDAFLNNLNAPTVLSDPMSVASLVCARTWLQDGESPPDEIRDRLCFDQPLLFGGPTDWFSRARPILWVEDPCTLMLSPYALHQGRYEEIARCLARTGAVPNALTREEARVLFAAEILWERASLTRKRRDYEKVLRGAASHFGQHGYASLLGLFPKAQLRAMQQYFRNLVSEGYVPFGDEQVPHRFCAYNEGLTRFLQHQLNAVVSRVFVRETKPSYVYMASYRPGAILYPHKDRVESQFSISFLVDYEPYPENASPWPLYVVPENGLPVACYQTPGDALFYKGAELTHYREKLGDGATSTSIFFQYVPLEYAGILE